MELEKEFADAVAQVKEVFPFANYVSDGSLQGLLALVRELKRQLPQFQGRRLLDIGCGPMFKTGVLQKMGFRCSAVDDLCDSWHQRDNNSEKICKFASDIGIEFHQQNIGDHTIPFTTESFDAVTALGVVEHLHESPRNLLNVMGSFARDGGLIIVTMPNAVNLRKRISVLLGRSNHVPVDQFYHSSGMWRGHVREYTLAETKYICESTGFEVLSSVTYEAIAQDKLPFPLRTIYLAAGKIIPSSRSSLLVVSRKPDNWKPAEYDAGVFRKATEKSVPNGVS